MTTAGGFVSRPKRRYPGIVMELWHGYRVTDIDGIRYGYEGPVQKHGHLPLKPDLKRSGIYSKFRRYDSGRFRDPRDIDEMVDGLAELGVDILFAIGGAGTLKCAAALAAEIQRRALRKSVLNPENHR